MLPEAKRQTRTLLRVPAAWSTTTALPATHVQRMKGRGIIKEKHKWWRRVQEGDKKKEKLS